MIFASGRVWNLSNLYIVKEESLCRIFTFQQNILDSTQVCHFARSTVTYKMLCNVYLIYVDNTVCLLPGLLVYVVRNVHIKRTSL